MAKSLIGAPLEDHIATSSEGSFDWISVIIEEYMNESSIKDTSLANSSALEIQAKKMTANEVIQSDRVVSSLTAFGNLSDISPSLLQDWSIGERHLLDHFCSLLPAH